MKSISAIKSDLVEGMYSVFPAFTSDKNYKQPVIQLTVYKYAPFRDERSK